MDKIVGDIEKAEAAVPFVCVNIFYTVVFVGLKKFCMEEVRNFITR